MQVDLKKLKPIGVITILLFSAVAMVVFFTVDFHVPPRYTPMHDTEYYRQHLDDLLAEVQENVLPNLKGVLSAGLAPDARAVVIVIEQKEFDKVKAVIARDFDESLFVFQAKS